MDKLDWSKEDEFHKGNSSKGCGFLFLFVVVLLGIVGFKTIDSVLNEPNKQILSQLSDFVDIPDYDRKDEYPTIIKDKEISESVIGYKIRLQATNKKEYLYHAKVIVKKKLFLQPKIKVIEVIEY